MSDSSSVFYFMMGNYHTHKEIGSYIDNTMDKSNFENIKFTCDDIFSHSSEEQSKNKKNKIEIENYKIFYTFTNSGIFYLAVIIKNSLYSEKENLVYELFEDVENRGIKKLVDKNEELTLVGKQNLKFCIEQDQEANRKTNQNISNSLTDFFRGKKEKDASKMSLLSNELNDIQTNVKESMKNIINNVTEMQDLDDKSEKIKDASYKFQKDSTIFERKLRYRKMLHKAMIFCIVAIIAIIIFYLIFK
jgi:hypothetical protein